jgi:hypothetical protein
MSLTRKLTVIFLFAILAAGCTVPVAVPPTPAPVQPTAPSAPTATPAPTLTPTPVLYPGPAAQYLPAQADLPNYLAPEGNLATENFVTQVQLPVAPENLAYASFGNVGVHKLSLPQEGYYIRVVYWTVVLPDPASAQLIYQMSNREDYRKQAFLVIMPGAVHAQMGAIVPVKVQNSPCEDVSVYQNASQVNFIPDLYIYASCRVKNVLVVFWGHTANNYDGKNAPLPESVVADQVSGWLKAATGKLAR